MSLAVLILAVLGKIWWYEGAFMATFMIVESIHKRMSPKPTTIPQARLVP